MTVILVCTNILSVVLLVICVVGYSKKVSRLKSKNLECEGRLNNLANELTSYGDKIKTLNENNVGLLENIEINNDELVNILLDILEQNFKSKSLYQNCNNVMGILKGYYGVDYITIFTYKTDLDVVASNINYKLLPRLTKFINETSKSFDGLAGKIRTSDDVLSYPTAGVRGIQFSALLPLTCEDTLIGMLLLENRNAKELNNIADRFQLYTKVLKCTSLVLHNALELEDLISMVSTDQLTGIYNRRYIDMTLANQVDIYNSLGTNLGVVLFDIDHFKKFNDTYGHQFGDLVLKTLASFIKSNLLPNSWVARYGGEEFVLCYSKLDVESIFKHIDYLRDSISKLVLQDGETTAHITISLGLAMAEQGITIERILKNADDALYESKNTGRNKTTVYKY